MDQQTFKSACGLEEADSNVYCWGRRVEKKIMELTSQENTYRNDFRDALFSIHDELMKHK